MTAALLYYQNDSTVYFFVNVDSSTRLKFFLAQEE